jgi:hypothetical protein
MISRMGPIRFLPAIMRIRARHHNGGVFSSSASFCRSIAFRTPTICPNLGAGGLHAERGVDEKIGAAALFRVRGLLGKQVPRISHRSCQAGP